MVNPRSSFLRHWSPLLLALSLPLPLTMGCVGERSDQEPLPDGVSYADTDQDGILDVHEGSVDSDKDGIRDYLDLDSDEDGIPDAVEAGDADPLTFPQDSDGDGQPDYRDLDSDSNGLPDKSEAGLDPANPSDLDQDGVADFCDPDNDGDTIPDRLELGEASLIDTDQDGVPDHLDTDSDADKVLDRDEAQLLPNGTPGDADSDGLPNFRDQDSDGDGIRDAEEAGDSDPASAPVDTDQDGLPDLLDLDSDGDAVADVAEASLGTSRLLADSDGDGYSDGGEQAAGSDPTRSASVPQMLYVVVPQRSRVDTTFSFQAEIGRADVVFVLDSTGSMGPTLSTLADQFSTVVEEVSALIPDTAFGVATFQDYNYPGLGGGTDKPFKLYQQVTSSLSGVQASLNGLAPGGGGDLAEAAMEALSQTATGRGFDQDCDDVYDNLTDVQPFIASANDAFAGKSGEAYRPEDVSTGKRGGFGFRPYALPIIVWTTDTNFRDPDRGSDVPEPCSSPAGSELVAAQINALGGKLIGVNAGAEDALTENMVDLSFATYSTADVNGDGKSDPLVFSSSGGEGVVDVVVKGIAALNYTGEFNRVTLVAEGDPYGFVRNIEPASYSQVRPGDTLPFQLELFGASPAAMDDQVFTITLQVVGDEATRLSTTQILVVVPGAGS